MTTDQFTVQADDPIEMIANLMIWERIRHVPVEDKDHKLIGLVTQRAVLRFIASHGVSHRTGVSAIMRKSAEVAVVSPETPTIDALRLMRRKQIGCLPGVHDGRLVGIVTEEDFLNIASKLLEERLGDGTVEAIDGPGTGRTSRAAMAVPPVEPELGVAGAPTVDLRPVSGPAEPEPPATPAAAPKPGA